MSLQEIIPGLRRCLAETLTRHWAHVTGSTDVWYGPFDDCSRTDLTGRCSEGAGPLIYSAR